MGSLISKAPDYLSYPSFNSSIEIHDKCTITFFKNIVTITIITISLLASRRLRIDLFSHRYLLSIVSWLDCLIKEWGGVPPHSFIYSWLAPYMILLHIIVIKYRLDLPNETSIAYLLYTVFSLSLIKACFLQMQGVTARLWKAIWKDSLPTNQGICQVSTEIIACMRLFTAPDYAFCESRRH